MARLDTLEDSDDRTDNTTCSHNPQWIIQESDTRVLGESILLVIYTGKSVFVVTTEACFVYFVSDVDCLGTQNFREYINS